MLNCTEHLDVDAMSGVDGASGAAATRRQRRLRAQWRHEQQSIAMGPPSSPPPQCWTVEEWREEQEEVYETHVALRGPKTTPPVMTRPGLLTEPAPQVRREAAARAFVVDGLPTFGRGAEANDKGALSFLFQQQLAPRVEEEEEQQVDKLVPESVERVQPLDPKGKICC